MTLKQKIKEWPSIYFTILWVLNAINYFDKRFWVKFPSYQISSLWQKRIDTVTQSPENEKIVCVQDAGKIFKSHQLMHNGLKIRLGSYYDYGNTLLLQANKGIHEPQEEFAFQEILKSIPAGGTMLELGSFWAFYSMWFASAIKEARCLMVEPDPHKMNFGKLNFKLNKLNGEFILGFIGEKTNLKKNIPVLSVDYILKKNNLEYLNILHSDIQGYEADMLRGSSESLAAHTIGFVFLSTHSNLLHSECEKILTKYGYQIIFSANLDESFSWDGVLIAKSPNEKNIESLSISKRA